MSDAPEPHSRSVRHVSDGTREAHYVLTGKDEMALVIEHDTPEFLRVSRAVALRAGGAAGCV